MWEKTMFIFLNMANFAQHNNFWSHLLVCNYVVPICSISLSIHLLMEVVYFYYVMHNAETGWILLVFTSIVGSNSSFCFQVLCFVLLFSYFHGNFYSSFTIFYITVYITVYIIQYNVYIYINSIIQFILQLAVCKCSSFLSSS